VTTVGIALIALIAVLLPSSASSRARYLHRHRSRSLSRRTDWVDSDPHA
jgi:hypothetical protein